MSDGGYEIISAGPLTGRAESALKRPATLERMPNVTVGPSGRLTLAYLTRILGGESSWRLCVAKIALEEATGKPMIASAQARDDRWEGAADLALPPSPPTFSTDGQAVFASAEGGQIKRYMLSQRAANPVQTSRMGKS